ncbi:DUF4192 family protein [Branchiibius cervicis]|uniref:DUF4192 family protein n=1 Tax=Branchiibius cervicis TaxID=908252 RepID=A0ABW2AR83_9MICO
MRRLRGIDQLLAYLPYLLGFHPRNAVVLAAWRDGSIAFQAHIDGADDDALRASMPALERGLRSVGADSVLLAVHGPVLQPPALPRVLEVVRRCGVPISHQTISDSGHWRAVRCSCGACPRDWSPLPSPEQVPAIAQEILEGAVPLPGRNALRELLQRSGPRTADWEQQIPRAPGTVAASLLAWLRGGCDHDQLIIAVRALRDNAWRDVVLSLLAPEAFPREHASSQYIDCQPHFAQIDRQLRLGTPLPGPRRMQWSMIDALPVIPCHHQAPVLTLIAANSWGHGGGADATLACERALHLEPGYPMAQLLSEAVTNAVPARPPESMSA